ncbi:hypothetical protein HanPI659440_Chr12g0455071 [Helianthus annuus]|nr:hypothetical protein HanPI659440_Chr12g0455071 [Helianthus annuus]
MNEYCADRVEEVLEFVKSKTGSKTWKNVVGVVVFVTFWRLWKCRNGKRQQHNNIPAPKIVELIKEDAFFWIKNRSRFVCSSWEMWIDFNVCILL